MFLSMITKTGGKTHGQMTMARLVKALETGWRLSCPPSCPDTVRPTLLLYLLRLCVLHILMFSHVLQVYTQMRRCWAQAPEERVDFKGLIEVFERLLSSEELSLLHSC